MFFKKVVGLKWLIFSSASDILDNVVTKKKLTKFIDPNSSKKPYNC